MKIGKLAILFLFISISGCSVEYEICNTEGTIYNTFKEKYTEWITFFERPENHNETIVIRVAGFTYGVRVHETSLDNNPVIYLVTNSGIPPSIMGESGYIYTLSSNLDIADDRYQVTELEPSFYCYIKIK